MFQIDNGFLRSKFARRIFLLFVFSAIIPVVLIASLSFVQFTGLLSKQTYEQSHIVCKAVGMELYRRLTLAHDELVSIGNSLEKARHGNSLQPLQIPDLDGDDFDSLSVFSDSGPGFSLRGNLIQNPNLTTSEREMLGQGKTLIRTQYDRENRLDIILIQAVGRDNAGGVLLAGVVDPDFIGAVNDLLPTATELLIVDPSGTVIHRSKPSLQAMIPQLMPLVAASISGLFNWSTQGEGTSHVSFWSVFTQDLFTVPSLVVAVSQPEAVALIPLRRFEALYIPLLLLAILCISFISANRIRKRLVPLATLQTATGRLAGGDFSGRVQISTDDEFAELGHSFNTMADRLESQFTSLSTMAEIDRLILSSFDARFIVSTFLARAGELTPCSVAAVLELQGDDPSSGRLSIRPDGVETAPDELRVELARENVDQLIAHPSHLQLETGATCPAYLAALAMKGTRTLLLFPAFVKERITSVLIFGFAERANVSSEMLNSLRKFADHVAVALSNASWEERLYHQAHYDTLTNLPNRALLKDRLEQAIARAQRNGSQVGVLFLDLDRFKWVNDSLGHAAGDIVLKKVAELLSQQVRSVDTVVRFGGDEFIVIVPDLQGKNDATYELGTVADKIFAAAQHQFEVDRQFIQPKMSIGIALYPANGSSPDELIKNADAAMYHAKNKGRDRYEFFEAELNAVATSRLHIEQDLRRALIKNEFQLYFQPKVDCETRGLLGAEALLRWHHPARGLVPPMDFIPIAEETGLIREIGEWVIRSACRQILDWRCAGHPVVPIAVNVSPQQFQEQTFTATVVDILREMKLDPDMLELEITETTVMTDAEESIAKLNKCREFGLCISMDDFGTGYSSLSYLRKLPIDTLKVDRSFVAAIDSEDETRAIVNATIVLAHQLGLKVVAEGVETETQSRLLKDMGCDALQGYLVSKPLPAEQFAERFLQLSVELQDATV